MLSSFAKWAAAGALCALAACSQTVTKSDGSVVETATPTWIANHDLISETFKDQKLAAVPLKSASRFYRSVHLGAVTGFDKPSMFSLSGAPISDADAAKTVTEVLSKSNLLVGNGQYVLDVTLNKYSQTSGTTTVIDYVIKDAAGAVVLKDQQTAQFTVPFKAAPMGALREQLGLAGSFENNLVQFANQLNSR